MPDEQVKIVLILKYGSFGAARGHFYNGNDSDFTKQEIGLFVGEINAFKKKHKLGEYKRAR